MSSHASKYHIVHKTKNGPTYRVELLKKGFVGSSTRKNAGGEIFTLEYESLDPKTVFSNPLQKSSLTLHLVIEGSSEITILKNIFGSDEDEYRLRLKIDGSTYWEGAVLADLMEYSEGELYSTAQIRAKDLSRLKGQTYSLTTGRDDIITVIAGILSGLGLGLGIKTATSWTEKNISDSDDFLDEISLDKSRIRKFATADGEEDQPYNKLEVLEMLCKNFGLILRQQDGYWWITQITEQANDPVTIYEYNSSGTFQSSSSVDLDAPVNKVDRWLQPQGQNKNYVGIQKAEVTFRHNTKEQILHLPDQITLTTSNSSIDPMDFLSDGRQTVSLSCRVEADENSGDAAEVTAFVEIRVGSSGNYYYLDNDPKGQLKWVTSQTDYEIELDSFNVDPDGPGIDDDSTIDSSGTWRKRFGVDFESPDIPADADGTIRITFKPAQDEVPNVVDETRYINIQFDVNNPTISEDNKSVYYTRTQAGNNYSETFSFGDTWFGDGPASYSKSALTYESGGANVATVSEWRRTGGSAELALQVLLLRELLDIQRNHIEGKRAALLGDYKTQQILTTDSGSKRYFFLSGQLSGKRSEWDGYFFRINIDTAGDDDIGTFYDDPDDTGTGGGGGGNPDPEDPDAVGEITSALSGTYSSDPDHIPIEVYAGKAVESGKDYYIYNRKKSRPISFTALEDLDVGTYNLDIEEQRIVAPSGSKIYKEEGQKETERLIQVEQQTATESARASLSLSVKNERQDTAIGTTTSELSGTITSIPIENIPFEIKLEDGDTLTLLDVVDDNEGANEDVTVNGNQTLTAGTGTVTVSSVALSNTYPTGSTLFEPAAGLTSRISLVSEVTTSNSSSIASLETDVSALESTLVLKAEVTSGNITKLAFVQLDASAASGSSITLSADEIFINGVTFDDDGVMYSSNFDGGITSGTVDGIGTIGWAMDRDGNLYANSATLRDGDIIDPNFSGSAVGLINTVATKADLPATGESDGDTYFVADEPGGLYVWDASTSSWDDTRDGQFLLADTVVASKINVATLSAISADIGVANINDTLTMGASGEITTSGNDYSIDGDGFWIPASGVLDASAYKMGGSSSSPFAHMRFDDSTPDEPFVEMKYSTVGTILIRSTETINAIEFETADLAIFNMPVQATSATDSDELITRGGGDSRYVRWSSVTSGTSIIEDSIITITAPSGAQYKVLAESI